MSIYKNGQYLKNNPGWHKGDSEWKAERIKEILQKNNLFPHTVCEVGSGTGEILNQLSEFYKDSFFTGYEISPQAYELSQRINKKNISFKLENILNTNVSDYELLMMIDVIEHIEDYLGFLKKIRSYADYKLFHIPIDLSAQAVLRSTPILYVRREVGHIHYFTRETALESLKDSGYTILDWIYTAPSSLPTHGWKTKVVNIPRKMLFRINKDVACRIFGGYSIMVLAK